MPKAEVPSACRTSARWGPWRARGGCFDRSELERDFWGCGSEPSGGSVGVPGRFRRGLLAAGWPDQGWEGLFSSQNRASILAKEYIARQLFGSAGVDSGQTPQSRL